MYINYKKLEDLALIYYLVTEVYDSFICRKKIDYQNINYTTVTERTLMNRYAKEIKKKIVLEMKYNGFSNEEINEVFKLKFNDNIFMPYNRFLLINYIANEEKLESHFFNYIFEILITNELSYEEMLMVTKIFIKNKGAELFLKLLKNQKNLLEKERQKIENIIYTEMLLV